MSGEDVYWEMKNNCSVIQYFSKVPDEIVLSVEIDPFNAAIFSMWLFVFTKIRLLYFVGEI